ADRQLNMWWQARAYPDPNYINDKFLKAWEQEQAMRNGNELARGKENQHMHREMGTGNWTSIGPNQTIGGRVLTIAIHPSNGSILFIGTASGGIWKTTTGGSGANAWQYVPTNLPVL